VIPTRGADRAVAAPDLPASVATTTIRSGDAQMDCFVVPWDSKIFGFAVAQIGRLELGTSEAATGRLFRRFGTWCAERQVRLASCRLDHARLHESMALEAHGFRFVEMVYEPRLEALRAVADPHLAIDVAEASVRDLPAIEEVASTAFTTGRFLLDQRLPPDLSGRRYAAWVRSAFEGSEQTVLKAELDGRLVGFFIAERRVDRSVYWHLTAVAPGWQGQGIGLSLWQTMLRRHAAQGAVSVETTVSGHNLPVLNLYARLGFAFASAQMTFHRLSAASS
jgi:GNAT superfamily N-acetyltransferase